MKVLEPLLVYLEQSAVSKLKDLIASAPERFKLVDDPKQAKVILFENDNPDYVRQTREFKQWSDKCIVVSERDEPSYFLPACYASNKQSLLSQGRVKTIPYFFSQRQIPNPFLDQIDRLAPRRYLYSFRGGSTSWVRKKLFKNPPQHDDVCIKETNQYQHWNFDSTYTDQKTFHQKLYAESLEHSSFYLCPRGAGISSIRLFEVMQAGRVPVIIADGWLPVDGIPWKEFAIFLPEKDIANLDSIIRSYENVAHEMGQKARQAWEKYCSPGADAILLSQLIELVQSSRNENKEQFIRSLFPMLELTRSAKRKLISSLKFMVLRAYALTGRPFPYSLNRPIEEQLQNSRK